MKLWFKKSLSLLFGIIIFLNKNPFLIPLENKFKFVGNFQWRGSWNSLEFHSKLFSLSFFLESK